MTKEASLSATFRAMEKHLRIDYRLTNRGGRDLFVIDVAIQVTEEGMSVETAVPRVELSPNDQVLLLSRLRPLDPSVSYAAPPMAYASRLQAGEVRQTTLEIPFPLIPLNLPPSKEVEERVFSHLTFVLGIVPATPDLAAAEQEIAGETLWRLPTDAWRRQKELRSSASGLSLRVLVNK